MSGGSGSPLCGGLKASVCVVCVIFVVWSRSIIYVWYPGSVDFGSLLVLCSICGMIEPCVRFGCIVEFT